MSHNRRALALGVAVALAGTAAPSVAAPPARSVSYAVTGCHEVAVIAPKGLVVLAYRCTGGTVGERALGPVVVHEVSEVQRDGTLRLLRSVVSAPALAGALRSLGLPAAASAKMTYTPPDHAAGGTSADLAVPGGRVLLHAAGATAADTRVKQADGKGVTYWYEGPRGRVELSYTNVFSGAGEGPGAGVGLVDASRDPALASWMGTPHSTGPAAVNRGSWTGTAVLTPRR